MWWWWLGCGCCLGNFVVVGWGCVWCFFLDLGYVVVDKEVDVGDEVGVV